MARYIMQAERKDYIDSKLIEYAKKKLYDNYFKSSVDYKVVTFENYVEEVSRTYMDIPDWISREEFVSLFEDELKADYAKSVAGLGSENEEG